MISIALIFGAPVIEPHGNRAAKISAMDRSGSSLARTVLTIWWTVGYASTRNSSGTSSVPTSLMREMSLRRRSTIMRFSAWFFGSLRRNFLSLASSALVAPRGAVPFIGLDLDEAFRVDLEEQLRRTRQHDRIAQADQRAVFHRLARNQRGEGGERITAPAGFDREGQIDLVAVALAQMPVHAVESRLVVGERPCRPGIEDRSVGGPGLGGAAARFPTVRRKRRIASAARGGAPGSAA